MKGVHPEFPDLRFARDSQERWEGVSIEERMAVFQKWRWRMAEQAEDLGGAAAAIMGRPLAEKLVSEVLPLVEGCRWLERNAARVLATERLGRSGRPFWLRSVKSEIQRRAFGAILVIGPGNYPLFLPAIHAMQALAAGNAVWIKPAPGTRGPLDLWASLSKEAGLPENLLTILPDSREAGLEAIASGPDKVIFTGSSENGRAVLAALAESATPSVMELSGRDCLLVLPDADLNLVSRALRFALRLNEGQTCMAPRRILAVGTAAQALASHLGDLGANSPRIEAFGEVEEAILQIHRQDFALGASIFTRDLTAAREIASRLRTGFVTINDVIVPTADPRLPFGGLKASGFGTTRGAQGLLEMTFPHVVAERRGRDYQHFEEPRAGDAQLFSTFLAFAHGRRNWKRLRAFIRAIFTWRNSK